MKEIEDIKKLITDLESTIDKDTIRLKQLKKSLKQLEVIQSKKDEIIKSIDNGNTKTDH